MSKISLTVNGHLHALDVDPSTPLLFVLADELGLRGPKSGAEWHSAELAPSSFGTRLCALA